MDTVRNLIRLTCLLLVLGAPGCKPPNKPPSEVLFTMSTAGLDYSVYLDGQFLSRLRLAGAQYLTKLSAGNHGFYVLDNTTMAKSEVIPFALGEGQRQTFTFGTGGAALRWFPAATFSGLQAVKSQSGLVQYVSIAVRLHVNTEQLNGPMTIGCYWLTKSAGRYLFVVPPSGMTCGDPATPHGVLGDMFTFTADRGDVGDVVVGGLRIPLGCFPARTSGTTYYAICRLYRGATVADPNLPAVAEMGPPGTIASFTF